jgi:hypothetical protein
LPLKGQTSEPERFVQVSGIITDANNYPVSGVAVISKKLRRGAISERTGIYSITSTPGDTIFFKGITPLFHLIITAGIAWLIWFWSLIQYLLKK